MIEVLLGLAMGVVIGARVRWHVDRLPLARALRNVVVANQTGVPVSVPPPRPRELQRSTGILTILLVAILFGTFVAHVHFQQTWYDYVTIEIAFIRLLLSGLLGFCAYWVFAITQRCEAYIPQLSESAKYAIKYLTLAILLVLLALLFYLQPSPFLTKIFGNIAQIETLGIKLQMQGVPAPSYASHQYVENDVATEGRGAVLMSKLTAFPSDVDDVRHLSVLSRLMATRDDMKYFRAINIPPPGPNTVGQNFDVLFKAQVQPMADCLLLVRLGRLPGPNLSEKVAAAVLAIDEALQREVKTELNVRDLDLAKGIRLPALYSSRITDRLLDLFNYLAGIAREAKLEGGNDGCASLTTQSEIDWRKNLGGALHRLDARQEHFFVLLAVLRLYHSDRYQAILDLDSWIRWVFLRYVSGGHKERQNRVAFDRDLERYCSGGEVADHPDRREDALLVCLTYFRVKIFQYAILQLYREDSDEKVAAIHRLLYDISRGVKATYKFIERVQDHGRQCGATDASCLRERCANAFAADCPEAASILLWLSAYYEMHWLNVLSRRKGEPSREDMERANAFCNYVQDNPGITEGRAAQRNYEVSGPYIRGMFAEACGRWLIRRAQVQFVQFRSREYGTLSVKERDEPRAALEAALKKSISEIDAGLAALDPNLGKDTLELNNVLLLSEMMNFEGAALRDRDQLLAMRRQLLVLLEEIQSGSH